MTMSGGAAIRPAEEGGRAAARTPGSRGIEWDCERLRAFEQGSRPNRIDKLASLVGRETKAHQEW